MFEVKSAFFVGDNDVRMGFVAGEPGDHLGAYAGVVVDQMREELDRLPAGKAIIVFVTQLGAMHMDWSNWGDFEIIFDEVPEIFTTFQIKAKTHAGLLKEHGQTDNRDTAQRLAWVCALAPEGPGRTDAIPGPHLSPCETPRTST